MAIIADPHALENSVAANVAAYRKIEAAPIYRLELWASEANWRGDYDHEDYLRQVIRERQNQTANAAFIAAWGLS